MAITTKLIASNATLAGSSLTNSFTWQGGRSVLVLEAATYGSGVFLQLKTPSGAGININASTYAANQVTSYDLPPGNYGVVVQSGTCTAFYAALCTCPYDF